MQSMCSVLNKRSIVPPFSVTGGRSASIRRGTVHSNIQQTNNVASGTGDIFSCFTWLYCTDITTDGCILQYSNKSSAANGFFLFARGTQAGDPFQIYINGIGSVDDKDYLFGQMPLNTWTQVGFTWGGPTDTLKVYQDGIEVTPTKNLDEATPALTEIDRWISLGRYSNWGGSAELNADFHSMGIWNASLSDDEITATYNSGNGEGFDLLTNSGNYVSSSSLQHWWRMGKIFTEPEWFDDYGLSPIDLDTVFGPASTWTTDDFAENAPTG